MFVNLSLVTMKVPGYTVIIEKDINVEMFIHKYFPGFAPAAVSLKTDELLAPLASTPLEKSWRISNPPPSISFLFASIDAFNEQTGVCLSRTFDRKDEVISVNHDYFTIPAQFRHQGKGLKILRIWLELYQIMKVRFINIHATLADGGYVWARAGFKATRKKDVDKIVALAKIRLTPERFRLIQAYYDDHYNTSPDQPFPLENWARLSFMMPILKDCSWYGQIDLTNELEMTNFMNYVAR